MGGFVYEIGVPLGIIFLITFITLSSFFCNRINLPNAPSNRGSATASASAAVSVSVSVETNKAKVGIDESTLSKYPLLLFSHAKVLKKVADSTTCCCSICLTEYKDTDLLRLLPDCDHLFHQNCIDQWLRLHPLCPVCRNSLQPTPVSSPVAQFVPLAMAAPSI
ncbi:RING-H2 finger protein [Quillaja saponaria]|uniref:RING-type E3 ubiquitin transferase n=1 Tax=Quillaja saponaria TaxID=32244 RepID=A0AAD7Q4P0_QUISA|nr:RING-H2 finger protein [Quillaja saponaria]